MFGRPGPLPAGYLQNPAAGFQSNRKDMKENKRIAHWLPSVLAGMALAISAGSSKAQTWANPQTFDTGKGSWITWNGMCWRRAK